MSGYAFEITPEDVKNVLGAHGIPAREGVVDLVLAEADRIEGAALRYDDLDDQTSSAYNEIELVLKEDGVLPESLPTRFPLHA